MVNEKRGSFWEQQVYAIGVAVVTAVIAGSIMGMQNVVWAFFLGTFYGMFAYECWLVLLDNCGSMLYEEGKEPERLTVTWAVGALAIPPVAVIASVICIGCLVIGTAKYYYDKAVGHVKTN